MWRDLLVKSLVEFFLRSEKIVSSLEIQPKLRFHPKVPTQSQCSVGG
jgi:hypothetical protein